jgi:hypothetical protein
LPLIQSLGANLADMIHAHQAGSMAAVGLGKLGRAVGPIRGGGHDNGVSRVRSAGAGDACHSAQGAVEFGDEAVEHDCGRRRQWRAARSSL